MAPVADRAAAHRIIALLTTATCACALKHVKSKMHEFQGPSNTLRSLQHEGAGRGYYCSQSTGP